MYKLKFSPKPGRVFQSSVLTVAKERQW